MTISLDLGNRWADGKYFSRAASPAAEPMSNVLTNFSLGLSWDYWDYLVDS